MEKGKSTCRRRQRYSNVRNIAVVIHLELFLHYFERREQLTLSDSRLPYQVDNFNCLRLFAFVIPYLINVIACY